MTNPIVFAIDPTLPPGVIPFAWMYADGRADEYEFDDVQKSVMVVALYLAADNIEAHGDQRAAMALYEHARAEGQRLALSFRIAGGAV